MTLALFGNFGDTYGLRKAFPENADMPDSEVVAVDEEAADIPHNRAATDIRRGVVEVVGNQRLQDHLRRLRYLEVVRLLHRTPDSHSIA